MIRVFIADDQLLIRRGLRSLLEMDREIEIAGEAVDGEEAIRAIRQSKIDLVLLDFRMPTRR